MSNKLQGWLAPNTLTEDPNDHILVLNSAGTVDNAIFRKYATFSKNTAQY